MCVYLDQGEASCFLVPAPGTTITFHDTPHGWHTLHVNVSDISIGGDRQLEEFFYSVVEDQFIGVMSNLLPLRGQTRLYSFESLTKYTQDIRMDIAADQTGVRAIPVFNSTWRAGAAGSHLQHTALPLAHEGAQTSGLRYLNEAGADWTGQNELFTGTGHQRLRRRRKEQWDYLGEPLYYVEVRAGHAESSIGEGVHVTPQGVVFSRDVLLNLGHGCMNDQGRLRAIALPYAGGDQPDPMHLRNTLRLQRRVPTEPESVVVVLAQHHGADVFHFLLECLPRLAIFSVPPGRWSPQHWLNRTLSSKRTFFHINAPTTLAIEMLQLLLGGISGGVENVMDQLVWGHVSADTVLVPKPNSCAHLDPTLGPILRAWILSRAHTVGWLAAESIVCTGSMEATVVLVRRSGVRRLELEHEHELIRELEGIILEGVSCKGTLEPAHVRVHIYSDEQLPSFAETIRLFHTASLVIAPHGAGLANALFAPSTTAILELLTPSMPNCFSMAAAALGQRYCGFMPRVTAHDGVIQLDKGEVQLVVRAARQLLLLQPRSV
jgi:hypothetical protein